jgi:hypothetical protein
MSCLQMRQVILMCKPGKVLLSLLMIRNTKAILEPYIGSICNNIYIKYIYVYSLYSLLNTSLYIAFFIPQKTRYSCFFVTDYFR